MTTSAERSEAKAIAIGNLIDSTAADDRLARRSGVARADRHNVAN